MKAIVILSVLLVGAFCSSFEHNVAKDLFNQWKLAHNKAYKAGHEEEHRFNIFLRNYIQIQNHNLKNNGVTLALNQFADLNSEEFANLYTGLVLRKNNKAQESIQMPYLPEKVDWRTQGAVGPVSNQLACGSCWAFSAVGALEGLYFVDHGVLESFSTQQLVDCVDKDYGCNGGWMDDAFEYTAEKGIERTGDYPYVARTQKCSYDATKAIHVNTGYIDVTPRSAVALKTALVAQPVSVAIQADQATFQFYRSGVITTGCGAKINHGVLAVGYANFSGTEAFIVKNSWGTLWGNQGYVLLGTDESQNNGDGVCGILSNASFPTN